MLYFTSVNAIRNLSLINEKISCGFCVGSITEKMARQKGYKNTVSAGGGKCFKKFNY